jgi:ParB family protein of integrating conjugative element (PFGI_1 class)
VSTPVKQDDAGQGGKVTSMSAAHRRAALATQTLLSPSAAATSRPLPAMPMTPGVIADDRDMDGSMMTLSILNVHTYEHNPRHRLNPLYQQIKESIRLLGITQTISVTRRPGESHYICFAGGNTRVTAQKELFQETGSPKYAEINVTYRAWRGEAAVLAAHLGENHTHGVTCYWDDVQGLMKLRDFVEAEHGIKLSSNDLHARAAGMGADFGRREVNYMVFANEYLAPIGPWLMASSPKVLQPAFSGLHGLAATFGVTTKCGEVLAEALTNYSLLLGHRTDHESVEDTPPEVALVDVTAALNEAFGALIGVPGEQVELMLAAKAANPRITADELRNPKSAPARRQKDTQSDTGAQQIPLPGPAILSPVRTPAAPQPTLRASVQAGNDEGAPAAEGSEGGAPQETSNAVSNVTELLRQITVEAELEDVLLVSAAMPLGYYMEFPEGGIDLVDGRAPNDPALRRAAWQLLASLSGQYDAALLKYLPEESAWRQASSAGAGGLGPKLDLQVHVKPHDGDVQISVNDLYRVLWHPQVGQLFAQLWTWAMYWRASDPDRFPPANLTDKLSVI